MTCYKTRKTLGFQWYRKHKNVCSFVRSVTSACKDTESKYFHIGPDNGLGAGNQRLVYKRQNDYLGISSNYIIYTTPTNQMHIDTNTNKNAFT